MTHCRTLVVALGIAGLALSVVGCGSASKSQVVPSEKKLIDTLQQATGVEWKVEDSLVVDEDGQTVPVDPLNPIVPANPNDSDGVWAVYLSETEQERKAFADETRIGNAAIEENGGNVTEEDGVTFVEYGENEWGSSPYGVFTCVSDAVCVSWITPMPNPLRETGPLWDRIVSALRTVSTEPS